MTLKDNKVAMMSAETVFFYYTDQGFTVYLYTYFVNEHKILCGSIWYTAGMEPSCLKLDG